MNKFLSTFLIILAAGPALAQERLQISSAEQALLDLEFAPVMAADRQVGVRLPGQVVAPPDASSLGISLYAGVLERWHHQAGADVAAGEVLATIRSADVLAIQQDYLDSHNELQLAQQKLDRDRGLFDAGIISRQRILETQATLRGTRLRLESLRQRLLQAGQSEDELQAMVAGNYPLGTFAVRAPVSGSLGHRVYTTGDYVPANAAVAELNGAERPWLSLQVPARLDAFLKIGSRLSIAGSAQTLTLRQRDFNIDAGSQTVEVLAEFDEQVAFVPGQLHTALLHPQPGSMLIPADAVVHEGTATLVYVRTADGVEVRPLDLMPLGEAYLASSGIRSGEQILIRGTALVKGMQLGLGSDE